METALNLDLDVVTVCLTGPGTSLPLPGDAVAGALRRHLECASTGLVAAGCGPKSNP